MMMSGLVRYVVLALSLLIPCAVAQYPSPSSPASSGSSQGAPQGFSGGWRPPPASPKAQRAAAAALQSMVSNFQKLIIPGQSPAPNKPARRAPPASSNQPQSYFQTRNQNRNQYQPPQFQQRQYNYPMQQQQHYRQPQYSNINNYRYPNAPLNIQKQVFRYSPQPNNQYQPLQQMLNARTFPKPKSFAPSTSTTKQSGQSDLLNQFIGKSPASSRPPPPPSSRSYVPSSWSNSNTQQLMKSFNAPRPAPASPRMNKHTVNSYIQALEILQRQFKSMFPSPTANRPRRLQSPQPTPQQPIQQPQPPPQRPTPPHPPHINQMWSSNPPQSSPPVQFSRPPETFQRPPAYPAPLPPQKPQQPQLPPPQPPQQQNQPRHPPYNIPPPPQKPSPPPVRIQPSQPPRPLPPKSNSPFLAISKPPVNEAPPPTPRVPDYRQMQYGECTVAYSPDQLCCDGIINNKPRRLGAWACCGGMVYNMDTHLCCDKTPIPNPGDRLSCCKKGPYNPTTQMCCGESVRPRPRNRPDIDCCGKHVYNPNTHLCCEEGNTYLRNPNIECCGKNTYNPDFEQCCYGDALPESMMCIAR